MIQPLNVSHGLVVTRACSAASRRCAATPNSVQIAIWTLFGVAAHLLDAALHALVTTSPWLTFNGWIIGAAVLALAGGFQFSALKYHCLDRCRTPLGFVMEHWRGRAEARGAF